MIAKIRKLAGNVAFSLVAAWAAMVVIPQAGLAQAPVTIDLQTERHAGTFNVPLNKSQVLRLDVPFADLNIGNPGIADVLAVTNRTIYVLGEALGDRQRPREMRGARDGAAQDNRAGGRAHRDLFLR